MRPFILGRRVAVAAASGGLLIGALAGAGPAIASSPAAAGQVRAGYRVVAKSVTAVTAHWVQPTVACGSQRTSMTVRVVVARDQGVAQFALGTRADCRAGAATYHAWQGQPGEKLTGSGVRVAAGDRITASIHVTGKEISFSIEDDTQGWGVGGAVLGPKPKVETRAFVGATPILTGAGPRPLARFSPALFRAVSVNKQTLGQMRPLRLSMRWDHQVHAITSVLRGPTNRAFRVTWAHS